MATFETVEPGTIALIQQTPEGRILQIGLTPAQSNMLQFFLAKLSEESKLIQMPEDYDLILKSSLCPKCRKSSRITPKYTQQKYYKLIMKPLYTEVFTLKISSTQKRTLEKLKSRNIKVSDFVRKAISEKIKRDYA